MSLTLIGLILSFIGSIILILDAFLSFGKEPTHFIPSKYGKDGRPTKFIREKRVWGINDGRGGYKEVKISKEEMILIVSLSLISLGFLL